MTDNKLINNRLRFLREKRKETLSAWSKHTGFTIDKLSKIERGETEGSIFDFAKILESINISTEEKYWLITGEKLPRTPDLHKVEAELQATKQQLEEYRSLVFELAKKPTVVNCYSQVPDYDTPHSTPSHTSKKEDHERTEKRHRVPDKSPSG
jgi:transcriptional regulator with XRE-family HTH domain